LSGAHCCLSIDHVLQGHPRNPQQTTDPYARGHLIFPALAPEQIASAIPFGRDEALKAGTVLFERGDRGIDFFAVLDGHIEIYEYSLNQPKMIMFTAPRSSLLNRIFSIDERFLLAVLWA
jgi:thioredoxin reductase (NADPH)